MQTVRDEDGTRYVLLKESSESSLVHDVETGKRRHLPSDTIEPVEGESPLVTTARGVPEPARRVLTAVPDERALGLLLVIDARDVVGVRELLAETDLCESDLHGLLAEFRAGGLVAETRVRGERGYETTDVAVAGLGVLRDSPVEHTESESKRDCDGRGSDQASGPSH